MASHTLQGAALAALLLVGCTSSSTCPAGTAFACVCGGGESGVQTCQADGTLGACVCAADGGSDAGPDGGADAGADAGPMPDAGGDAGLDAGPDAGTDAGPGGGADAGQDGGADGGCALGQSLHITTGIDACMPQTVCTSETCPPQLGSCDGGVCLFNPGYSGVQTIPQAWATYYCDLEIGSCNGVSQFEPPATTASKIAQQFGIPSCARDGGPSGPCAGIAASSPMVVGNGADAVDPRTNRPVATWGLGLTEASGICYQITGPSGTAIIALTDRCAGYCKCNGSGFQECGTCVNAADMAVNCSCIGPIPGVYTQCCGVGCATTEDDCDWCASNNHLHFDLDVNTFNHVCGTTNSNGSCQLSQAQYVPCLSPNPSWPPSQSGAGCQTGTFYCAQPMQNSDQIPQQQCCCEYNLCPQSNGSCSSAAGDCHSGSCACLSGQPDAEHPLVPSTGCCCVYGTTPQSDGTCQ